MLKNRIKEVIGKILYIPNSDALLQISKENYWANVFNSTITDSPWLKNKSFSPGRWAVNYSFLYVLYRILNDIRPEKIIEFGLGQSSKMTIQYLESQPGCFLEIIEHNEDWITSFYNHSCLANKNIIHKFDLEEVIVEEKKSLTYKSISEFLRSKKYNLIIIDGPFGSDHFSRPQLLDFIYNDSLNSSFIIIVDDYDRIGEKETVKLFTKMLDEKKLSYCIGEYYGEKGQCVICSKDYEFITSL